MRIEDLVLVSVDDHEVEPPDLFEGHLPEKYKPFAPRVEHRDDDTDVWVYEGQVIPNVGLNAVAGRPKEEYGVEPTSFAEIRPGCYDVHERVRDMDAGGVLGSLCFPSMPGFAGRLFASTEDKDVAYALLAAYNDWHVDEWCGTYPGRFIPLMVPPIWDPELMAREVRRLAAKGCHAVTFSENPEKLGFPSLHNPHWDPFWAACADEGTIICLHIGSSASLAITSIEAPIDVMITLQPMNIVQAAADLVWSRVLREFPTITFALSEGGIGWIPYFLERIDRTYEQHHLWTMQDFGERRPSDVFREHIVTCFIDDPIGLRIRDAIGVDLICWEQDYPHSDSTWPNAPEALAASLAGLSDEEVDKVTHLNAMRHFRYDPFSVLPREECTVGALRARAAGVDVSPRPGYKPAKQRSGPVTTKDLIVTA
jgi:predicted TIM-barrel fold metal-dependent hydrolase